MSGRPVESYPRHLQPVSAHLVNLERRLISRKILFGNPTHSYARISPDAARLAFLAPVDNVLNVWVTPAASPADARPVTRDRHRGIRAFAWAYTNRHILYTQDTDGDEDWHVYCVDLATDEIRDLTPIDKIAARIEGVSARVPEDVLVGINDRGEGQLHDVYRIHIGTGERTLVQENLGFASFAADDDYRVRFAVTVTADAGHLYLKPEAANGWREWVRIEPEDAMTTHPAGFDKTAAHCYMLDSRGRDTSALKAVDLETGAEELLAETDLADIDGVLIHPKDKHVQAVSFTHSRRRWHVVDPEIQGDLDYLARLADGDIQVTSRSLDDRVWTVAFTMDTGPARFYLYDRTAREARFLFTSQPELEGLPLARMHPVIVRARDGLELVSYLSLPVPLDPEGRGRPERPLPMVLLVHGGPWARDDWGYDPMHQWLADRGYAVLSVNYRGSTGFGKDFINRANREWAAAMHDDLIDVVDWAVAEGIADRDRVAIMGGSYGGVRHPGRVDVHAGPVRLWRGYRWAVQSDHTAGEPAALLGADDAAAEGSDRRLHDERGAGAAGVPVAAEFRGPDPESAADRTGTAGPARQAGRIRPDCRGPDREGHSGRLHAVHRRGARVRQAREPDGVLRRSRGVPSRAPRRPRRADRGRV